VNAIVASDVHKTFRPTTTWGDLLRGDWRKAEVTALAGVDLTVGQGELVGLAGPNGAGKSTFLRSVAGLLLPTQGSVHVCGLSSQRDDLEFKRTVGYAVGDERSHFWRLTGRQNLEFFATLHGYQGAELADRVAWVLDAVDLTAPADRAVRVFSTGMRQRLALARGLLGRPRVLLLDEPTRGLDPRNARRVRRFVREELLEAQKMTVIYATHNVTEMQDFCPRLVLLDQGKLVGDGAFDDVADAFESVFGA